MKKTLLLVVAFAMAMVFQVNAQVRKCAADDLHKVKMANNPEYAKNQQNLERLTEKYIADVKAGRVSGGNVVIPCIVHVVYANSQENISTAQVQSQIDRLNDDFSATNSDYNQTPSIFTSVRSGDNGIRFELLETKRYSNSRSTWGTSDLVKSTYPPIEPARILNMWVADIGGGILGYAQFPNDTPATDGVVMSPQYFGDASKGSGFYLSAPFNLGRTATHEVGHWLNLRHIWGDGGCSQDDFVSDTPVAGQSNGGCPAANTNTCSGGESDMFMNYMDYVDDACMFMFSAGQKSRMNATFSNGGGREGFLLDPVYTPGGGSGGGGGTTCDDTEVSFTLVYDQYPSETSWTLKKGSTTVASGNGSGASANSTATQTLCLVDGDYTFTINDSYGDGICCTYGNGSYSFTNGSTDLASGGQFTSTDTKTFTIGGSTGGGGGGTGGGSAVLGTYDFESGGFQGWADGGSDCARYTNGTYSYGGNASIRIRDNTSSSVMSSPTFSAASYDAVEVEFFFYANSMENNEDFWVQASTNGGSSYSTIATYARGANFDNGTFYSATVTVPASNNLKIRFRCDASGNNDQIYIDDVTVTGVSSARLHGNTITNLGAVNRGGVEAIETSLDNEFSIFPNPASDILNIRMESLEGAKVQIYNVSGQLVREAVLSDSKPSISVAGLKQGIYILKAVSGGSTFTKRFVKQ
jgi:hypothetical protein